LPRFITYALPLLILLLALFGFTVEILDAEPRPGSVLRLALSDAAQVPAGVVLGSWLMEACGLLALYLLARKRFGAWWVDGLVAGSLAWVFRGPLLVITLTVAVRQSQDAWWTLVFGWWVLYCICGLALALLARNLLDGPQEAPPIETKVDPPAEATGEDEESEEDESSQESPSAEPEANEADESSPAEDEVGIEETTEEKGH
jgi:hypothetical protein